MKKKHRIISALVAAALAAGALFIVPGAAEAEPVEIDGIKTAFVSGFGRINYGGKNYTSFKTLEEGIASLGDEGGRIVFTGQHTYTSDELGSGEKLVLEGTGTKTTGNHIKFTEPEITLTSDISVSLVSFTMPESNYLILDGHDFVTAGDYEAYYTITNHTTGARNTSPLLNICGDGEAVITNGNFGLVSASAVSMTGGSAEKVVIGADETHRTTDAQAVIGACEIDELVIGAQNGTMSGNIEVTVDGGTIGKISTGAYGAQSEFSGNAVVTVDGNIGEIASAGDGKTTGKIIYVCSVSDDIAVSDDAKYENLIALKGGSIELAYGESGEMIGIYCYDNYGCLAEKLMTGAGEILPENGMFKVTPGKLAAEIISAVKLGINDSANFVAGYEDGTFAPQNNMTRAEAITLLTRIITDENIVKNGSFTPSFEDVDDSAWYANYIEFFNRVGLLTKLPEEGKMNPSSPITRGEFVQLIYNIENVIGVEQNYANFAKLAYNVSSNIANAEKYDEFSDVRYDNDNNNAIYHAVANGYVNGYEDGTFKPDGNITRAEVVTVVNRMLGRRPTGNAAEASFSDIEGHWAKSQVLAAANPYGTAWTRSSDEKSANDGTALPAYVEKLMKSGSTKLVKTIAVNLYKTASASLVADDIKPEEKTALSAVLDDLKTSYREVGNPVSLTGSFDDPNHHLYNYVGKPYVRDIKIDAVKPTGNKVEIVQVSDTHFNYINEDDEIEQNPSVMSTKLYRKWLAGGASVGVISRVMEWAKYSDQTIITGDVLDYISNGCKELAVKTIFRADTDVMACFGNHDITRVCQGKVADPTTHESRVEWMAEFWPNDTYYASRVVKDSVMCIVLDNGKNTFWDVQVDKLKADIELAREKGYTVLIFYHIPLSSRNPDETAVVPIRNNDGSGEHDFFGNALGKEGSTGATAEVYKIITESADVIKGAFCGHYHSAYYSEILASYIDENGNKVETVIPQYVQTASVYDTYGHVLKITVE